MSTIRELNAQEIDQVTGAGLLSGLPILHAVTLNISNQVDKAINGVAVAGLTTINNIGKATKTTGVTSPVALLAGNLYLAGATALLNLEKFIIG